MAYTLLFSVFRLKENQMLQKMVLTILITTLIIVILPLTLEACPSCKNLDEPIARGFNWSVMFMMAMPFTVFGIIGGSVFYTYRRANRDLKT